MKAQMFSRSVAPVGQFVREFTTGNQSVSWTVPDGVFFISAVVVSAGVEQGYPAQHTQIKRGAEIMLAGDSPMTGGVGGGNGGATGSGGGGGGGAGGYSGNGGAGAAYATDGLQQPVHATGANGAGGGGGGGGVLGGSGGGPRRGGGVGLLGIGANGAGGVSADGGHGSQFTGSGAYGGPSAGISGGNLRWKNDIPVTPGETLTLVGTFTPRDWGQGALRIMWGGGRSYPSNALNM